MAKPRAARLAGEGPLSASGRKARFLSPRRRPGGEEEAGRTEARGGEPRRTGADRAVRAKALVDHPRDASAARITLVCDDLDTHRAVSLYKAFPPQEGHRIARRLELAHGSKRGSEGGTSDRSASTGRSPPKAPASSSKRIYSKIKRRSTRLVLERTGYP